MTTIAILATLDTKGAEAAYIKDQIELLGGQACLFDMGVVGQPGTTPDVSRDEIAEAGGLPLADILAAPTRQDASPIFIAGTTRILHAKLKAGEIDGVLALGGTQGTSNATQVLQALPYGLPKIMVSTMASGDTSAFVGIKDITMMPSVGDILGLNPVTRKILSNAAGAAWGMAQSTASIEPVDPSKPTIGMTNLGVLTEGSMHAIDRFRDKGYEVIVFHAVGSGGLAMEQMMREGLIGAVFDYSLAEVADQQFDALRAADDSRLTTAGEMGLPQVLVPGGLEHVGLLVPANTVPERWAGRPHVFHNPIILAPRLNAAELAQVAEAICERLVHTQGQCVFAMPMGGTSRYSIEGGPLHDPEGDAAFLAAIRTHLPKSVELIVSEHAAEDDAFVDLCVDRLVDLIEG